MHVCRRTHTTVHIQRPEDSSVMLVLSFHLFMDSSTQGSGLQACAASTFTLKAIEPSPQSCNGFFLFFLLFLVEDGVSLHSPGYPG